MVNWNSAMIRRKGQAIKTTLQVDSVKNNDGIRQVTFSIPDLPDGYEMEPIVMRFAPNPTEESMPDAVQSEEGDEAEEGKESNVKGKAKRGPHGLGG